VVPIVRLSRLCCAAIAAVASVAGLLAAVTSASAQGAATPPPIRVGTRPLLPPGTAANGTLPASTRLQLEVVLNVRDEAGLTSFIADLSDPQSRLFDQFLRPGQFGARFGATAAQVATVDAALRLAGLAPGPVSSDRLSIPVVTTAAAAERAFGITLARYRLATGRVAYANTRAPRIAGLAAPYVSGVLGLDDLAIPQSHVVRPGSVPGTPRAAVRAAVHRFVTARQTAEPAAVGPQPCSAATRVAADDGTLTANEFAEGYGMTPLYQLGDKGSGVRVALVEFEPNSKSDVAAYLKCYGIHTRVRYFKVHGGAGSGVGIGEAALDIEDVAGLAPDATIDVYQAPHVESSVYPTYAAIVNADRDKVVSTSWGGCEEYAGSALMRAETSLFEQAAAQGQTAFAAAGDTGSADCYRQGGSKKSALTVDDPASQPYVVGVGGTELVSASPGQAVWNDAADGAGGGGVSAYHCMPSYQHRTAIPGLLSKHSKKAAKCGSRAPYRREVPDVSADADPRTGYTIYYDGKWTPIGGTSAAAPLWAAVAALVDASPFCRDYHSGDAGVRPQALYGIAARDRNYVYTDGEVLTDIRSGNNDDKTTGYKGGLYPATKGYDMASGLGTPVVSGYSTAGASNFFPGLAALMCRAYATRNRTTAITRVSPSAGPGRHARTVTITGYGFIPIAGADLAAVGKTYITAKCTSSRKCTLRLPSRSAGTVVIRMHVEDLAVSRVTHATKYTYAAAPRISRLSPAKGRKGTRVTIIGKNFIGFLSVHFGKKVAKIESHTSTKIVVVVPAGSRTVSVTVKAAGGSSNAGHYRYA
jgi:subtilase family serine protease